MSPKWLRKVERKIFKIIELYGRNINGMKAKKKVNKKQSFPYPCNNIQYLKKPIRPESILFYCGPWNSPCMSTVNSQQSTEGRKSYYTFAVKW